MIAPWGVTRSAVRRKPQANPRSESNRIDRPARVGSQMLDLIRAAIIFPLVLPSPSVASGLKMAVPVIAVTVIANGVVPPVSMAAFPAMKTPQPKRVAE